MNDFNLDDYTVDQENVVRYHGASIEQVGVWSEGGVGALIDMIRAHAEARWEPTLPEGVTADRVLSAAELYDQCSVGAGAAMTPVGPVGIVRFEFASSARPFATTIVNLALPNEALRDLRQVIVRGFGEAIERANRARRTNG